jgi:xylulokinase
VAEFLLGIDIGTTATKATLIHPAGRVVADLSAPVRLHSPAPGWAEEDPNEWWRNVETLVPRLLRDAGLAATDVAAVGVSGMVPTLICLDSQGHPLRRSIQQNDARATVEIAELRERLAGVDVLGRTGSAISQQSIGPTVLWLRRHEPDVIAHTVAIRGSYEYITGRLTGDVAYSERNWALESGLYDFRAGAWAGDIVRAGEIDPAWLGEVRGSSEVVGAIGPDAAAGLAPGTPVVAGSADHVGSAFSAGLVEDGDMLVKLGGAGDILISSTQPVVDERLYLDFHLRPGAYLPNGCMAASGSLIRWFQSLVGGPQLADLDREAEMVGAGAGGLLVLPYFLGEKTPVNDPDARGVFVGLHLGHERGHLFRAILESIAFGFAHHLDVFRERGLSPRRTRVTNGGSRSRLWRQIVSDVLGLPMESITDHPGSSLGAAFAAGIGTGLFDDWGQIERFVRIADRIEPDSANHEYYVDLYAAYRSLYPTLRGHMHTLARSSSHPTR